VFVPKGAGESYITRNFIMCTEIKSRRMRWAGHVACMEEMRNTSSISVGKREGKRLLGRPMRK
jgi:hypothetical protein